MGTRVIVKRKPKAVVHKRYVHKRRIVVKKPKVVVHKRYHRRRNWTVSKYKGYYNPLYANRTRHYRRGRALVLRYKKYWAGKKNRGRGGRNYYHGRNYSNRQLHRS